MKFIKKYNDDYFIVKFYNSSSNYFLCDQINKVSLLLKKFQEIVIPNGFILKNFNNLLVDKKESNLVKDKLIEELKNKYYIGTYDEIKEKGLYPNINKNFSLNSSESFSKEELSRLMFLDLKNNTHHSKKPYGVRFNTVYDNYSIDFYSSLYKIENYFICFLQIEEIDFLSVYKFDNIEDYIKFVKFYKKGN